VTADFIWKDLENFMSYFYVQIWKQQSHIFKFYIVLNFRTHECFTIDWFWKSGWLIHKSTLCTRIVLWPVRSQNDLKVPRKLIDVTNISISKENRISKSDHYKIKSPIKKKRASAINVCSGCLEIHIKKTQTQGIARHCLQTSRIRTHLPARIRRDIEVSQLFAAWSHQN